jgi:hypothetical protein
MDHHFQLALFHALIIAPLFIYVGLAREQVPDTVFYALGAVGLVIAGYHGFKAYTKILAGQSPWVNYIHIFVIAPLLIILGIYQKTANRKYFEILLMVGFAGFGYHSLTMMREIMSR